ncbi:MAG: arsenical pump-driving ATPase [Planctomycetaceae bacterium]|nr:arsenical pump-driving ATPase [Planctomycetaceae bacterium]
MQFLKDPTRNLLFTGKGGVGKTSMACAAAIELADRGRQVLLVSTDPASNLDEVLATPLDTKPTAVRLVANLMAMNIDPELAAREYRERIVGPYRGVLPVAAVESMEEQFSGACTLEIAAFDEFARLLGDQQATQSFDHIVFDTAPTGHTLRLLTLPSAWTGFMEANTTGSSCLGSLAGLQVQQQVYQETVNSLRDPDLTTLVLVTRPEISASREAARTSVELKKLGVENQYLIVNGAFDNPAVGDRVAKSLQVRCQTALAKMPVDLKALHRTTVPLASGSLLGIDALRQVIHAPQELTSINRSLDARMMESQPDQISSIIDQLAASGHGVILAMGKGGVGKTTVAAAVAVALAERGFQVDLSTTDPASHLSATLAEEKLANLSVACIDPQMETSAYVKEVMQTAGENLDEAGKKLLQEDLSSPCTEEVAVFRAFARAVSDGTDRFVVLDTAPTGHTILLLDSALAYHRELDRQSTQISPPVSQLLPLLRDPEFTRVLIVTVPEATPVHEAARLQEDLRRAQIEPYAWVVNQSLVPLNVTDPVLMERQHHERHFIAMVQNKLADRITLVPWQEIPPIGLAGLRQIVSTPRS